MSFVLATHGARHRAQLPAAQMATAVPSPAAEPAARSSRVRLVRRLLLPVALVLYAIALPGLIAVGPNGAGHAFTILAAVAAGISLLGIAGAQRVRVSRWAPHDHGRHA